MIAQLNVGAIQSLNTLHGRHPGQSSSVSTILARRDQWYVPPLTPVPSINQIHSTSVSKLIPNHTPDGSQAYTTTQTTTFTPIGVIADNEEHLVHLPNIIRDANLDKSVITKRKAFQTNGRIKPVQPITFTTASGHCLASSATITLRWRYDAGLQSFQETFYVVEGCGQYDAILRRDIQTLDDGEGAVPKAFPMQFGSRSKTGKEDRKNREAAREERDKQYERELEIQKAQLRKQMEGMKGKEQRVR